MKGLRSTATLICLVPVLSFSPHRSSSQSSAASRPAAAYARPLAGNRHKYEYNGDKNSYASNDRLISRRRYQPTTPTSLSGGIGIAETYQWEESQYEIDVTVSVPAGTRARDVKFKASPTGVDLKLKSWNGDICNDVLLLDGTRKMRGRVSVDGTYWAIADGDKASKSSKSNAEEEVDDDTRQITVTIEKMIVEPQDQFEVVEFDWRGVYPDDDDEVKERKYDKGEELDVREYAASLGVDIDNINMTMVDKTMFSSGLNMTQSTMDELGKAGYVKEVTQQGDGKEFVTGKDGEKIPFQSLGENIGADEIMNIDAGRLVSSEGEAPPSDDIEAGEPMATSRGGTSKIRSQLPFIDTHSKWHQSIPAEEARDEDGMPLDAGAEPSNEIDPAGPSSDATETSERNGNAGDASDSKAEAVDPIDLLTVKRLKEILREQNLKVSGNKQELRDRLRAHVNSKITDERD